MRDTPKATIIRSDTTAEGEWQLIQDRRPELKAQLIVTTRELTELEKGIGAVVVSGGDYKRECKRLAELSGEIEALQSGLVHLDNQETLLRRFNPGLDAG